MNTTIMTVAAIAAFLLIIALIIWKFTHNYADETKPTESVIDDTAEETTEETNPAFEKAAEYLEDTIMHVTDKFTIEGREAANINLSTDFDKAQAKFEAELKDLGIDPEKNIYVMEQPKFGNKTFGKKTKGRQNKAVNGKKNKKYPDQKKTTKKVEKKPAKKVEKKPVKKVEVKTTKKTKKV